MAVMMKGFAMKKVLKDGKLVGEKGIMGEYDGDIARIVEVSNGQAKYTELSKRDIEKLISMQASPESLERRLISDIKMRRSSAKGHHTKRRHKKHKRHTKHKRKRKRKHHTRHKCRHHRRRTKHKR